MGIELDVLVGHPEHELLFVATQVMTASGLQHGKRNIQRYKEAMQAAGKAMQVRTLKGDFTSTLKPSGVGPRWLDSWLFNESALYEALLKSKAPQTEPFRKWVTEEVLPTIRKTGKYDAEQSTDPIAVGLMDELKALRTSFRASLSWSLVESLRSWPNL